MDHKPNDENQKYETNESNENVSFNSVTDHYRNVMGAPTKRVNMNSLPKPIRWFMYFIYTVAGLAALSFLAIIIYQIIT
ncbi:hypothetical protein ACFQ3J_10505 [Paenibacillus provencensis]|uniref:Uncharacterized protein n=1 Tax=Paenibacillus provencensis TaxID=441151 RepID=A0ABW3PSQ1_9BACL|nr:hypothetical protein [Paenibacillus sp. MER 78]MCM3130369.1 hypothetical protein [Paenibacillus sp. MER 78]